MVVEQKRTIKERFRGFINFHFVSKTILIAFILFLLIRVVIVIIGPVVTSDLLRNIFYGQQFWEKGFSVYNFKPLELDPGFNVLDPLSGELSWPNNTYDYSMLHLLFFALISLFTAPVVLSKLIFVIFDTANFFLLNTKEDYRLLAWLYFIVSIPFSSVEGQVESITVFIFLIGLTLYEKNHKLTAYVIAAIGFHWKIIPVILFPYFFIKDLIAQDSVVSKDRLVKDLIIRTACFFVPFTVLFIFPMLSSKYLFNSQFFIGFQYDVSSWNPLYLFNFTLSALLLVITLVLCVIFWINLMELDWKAGINYILLIELIVFFSVIYKYAMPWAWLYFIPGLFIIPNRRETRYRELFISLMVVFVFASLDFLNMTVGFQGLQDVINLLFP
ncbi:MAG: hypothetical protein ACTSP4_14660 [Candidatus Hodarchaeales archaeon]